MGLVVVVGGLGLALLVNATRLTSGQPPAVEAPRPPLDRDGALERLSGAIALETVAPPTGAVDPTPFLALHRHLAQAYPRVHDRLRVETVDGLSLLFTWPGREARLPPVVLMGHLDVVPVSAATRPAWRHDPFGGVVADSFVWGRGALDDKSGVLATLEACEALLAAGFAPRRTIYLAFGHDEETGGRGAAAIARTLTARGVDDYALVLDEGGAIMPAATLPGLDQPVALVGVAEKTVLDLRLTARADGGHASSPPAETAIGLLGGALARLADPPFPARLDGVTGTMLRHVAPEMGGFGRLVFGNLWLFHPIVTRVLAASPDSAALVRTTVAPTRLEAGTATNVLPDVAQATLNLRLRTDTTFEAAVEAVRQALDDDRITVEILGGRPHAPLRVSSHRSAAFELIARTARTTHGEPPPVVTPYLTIAAVDARWYAQRSDRVFRFRGVRWEKDATTRLHGVDERVGVEAYLDSIAFLRRLIRGTDTL